MIYLAGKANSLILLGFGESGAMVAQLYYSSFISSSLRDFLLCTTSVSKRLIVQQKIH